MKQLAGPAAVAAACFLLAAMPSATAAAEDDPPSTAAVADEEEKAQDNVVPGAPDITGTTQDGVLDFEAIARTAGSTIASPNPGGPLAPHVVDFMRAGTCAATSGVLATPDQGMCADTDPPPECEPPATPVMPLWRRDRTSENADWGPWTRVSDWSCSAPDTPTDFTATDFQRLPLDPPGIRVQPATPEVLVNIPTITMAEAPEQTLTTTLLGTPVEVRAEATSYTWDYGDGSDPLTTTSPGHPYPDHDVHHTYMAPGTYTISLTATWTGEWRISGTTTWLPVQGTATTSTTHTPITAVEVRARLVAENCIENPHGPGC